MAGFSPRSSQPRTNSQRGENSYGTARQPNRMPWQRHEAIANQRAAETRPAAGGEDSVSRSVRVVEQTVENLAALQDNCDYYKELAIELRKAFDDEKDHARTFAQQLAETERSLRADRDRAARAEEKLEQSVQANRELERQLATVRSQIDRLVHTIARLMSAEKARDGKAPDIADLLAA